MSHCPRKRGCTWMYTAPRISIEAEQLRANSNPAKSLPETLDPVRKLRGLCMSPTEHGGMGMRMRMRMRMRAWTVAWMMGGWARLCAHAVDAVVSVNTVRYLTLPFGVPYLISPYRTVHDLERCSSCVFCALCESKQA